MMRCIATVMIFLLCTGCTTRLVDFTIISSKNMELDRAASYERAKSRVEGRDLVHIIFIVPTGVSNAKEAMDQAIESVPGAVALVDGVIYKKWWSVPLFYGQQSYVVEGTPLIDPQLASTWKDWNYMITIIDDDGSIKEAKIITENEYNSIKAKILPKPGS